jgi:hypothetical protein
MKRILSSMMIGGLFLSTATLTFAEGKIGERKENQQKRIANGVANGSLTAGETAKIEHQEANINKEVAAERAANGGKLTPAERRQVNRQQNRTSKEIYRDKHNGRVQAQ